MIRLILLCLLISSCDNLNGQYKCKNNKVYFEYGGAWIESTLYKNDKCLSEEQINE